MSIDFDTLKVGIAPNYYLMLPRHIKAHARSDAYSPIFTVAVSDLVRLFLKAIRYEPKVTLLSFDKDKLQFDFIQRSLIIGFPDDITVRFYGYENQKSTLALYSRSRYGFYDMGVNKRRVQRWVRLTKDAHKQRNLSLPELSVLISQFPR
jgi:uncharacterized protein (DUF1499 family)